MKFKLVESIDNRLVEATITRAVGATDYQILQTLSSWKVLDRLFASAKFSINCYHVSNSGGQGSAADGKHAHHLLGSWRFDTKKEISPQEHSKVHAIIRKHLIEYFKSIPEIMEALKIYRDGRKLHATSAKQQLNERLYHNFFKACYAYIHGNKEFAEHVKSICYNSYIEYLKIRDNVPGQLELDI